MATTGNKTAPAPKQEDRPAESQHKKVNINTISLADLKKMHISQFSESRKEAIISHRDANGPYESMEALGHVGGIGHKFVEHLETYFEV